MSKYLEKLPQHPADWWVPRIGVYGALVVGVIGLISAINALIAVAALVLGALTASSKFDKVAGQVLGAIIVATFALVGFNVLTDLVAATGGTALDWIVAASMVVLIACGLRRRPRWNRILIITLALVALSVLTDVVPPRMGILVGLIVAVGLFVLVAHWRLREAKWEPKPALGAAILLAVVAILVAPIVAGLVKGGSKDVPPNQRVASKLDVLIVTDGHQHSVPGDPVQVPARGFDVRYSVGFADGDRVRWTITDEPSADAALRVAAAGDRAATREVRPVRRQAADPVLALLVDGTDPVTTNPAKLPDRAGGGPGEVDHWTRVALAAAPGVPTFALLQTKNEQRLKQWEPFVKPGRAVSMQTLGSQTATDAAVRLSIAAPTSQADFSLAVEHRPLLLFDSDEPVPRPLSVASLFSEKRVRLCRDRAVQTKCSQPIRDATELQNGRTHLQLELPKSEELRSIAMRENGEIGRLTKLAATTASSPGSPPHATPPPDSPITDASGAVLGQGSTIYVHPVSSERDGRQLLYLDYWWYLPDNPAGGLGLGAFCGAGLVIPGVTCHNHESDWEGLTVVVDRTEAKPVVTAVQYAQHDDVLRYDWHALVRRWHREKVLPALTKVAEASGRPLAFSARGTHSTYPTPCDPCHQVVNDNLNEDKHRGDLPWIGNYTLTCGDQDCLQMLPTREGGSQPALWNAFAGLWGTRRCVLVFYCDSGSPPAAPGRQERYKHPTFYDGVVGEDGTFKSQPFDG